MVLNDEEENDAKFDFQCVEELQVETGPAPKEANASIATELRK